MKKIRYSTLLLTILSLHVMPVYSQTMREKIIKSRRVRLWKAIVKRVVKNEEFKRKCNVDNAEVQKKYVKILTETTPLFDQDTKRYLVEKVIPKSEMLTEEDILQNAYSEYELDVLLDTPVPEIDAKENTERLKYKHTLEQVLVQRAIKLINKEEPIHTDEPRTEQTKASQEEQAHKEEIIPLEKPTKRSQAEAAEDYSAYLYYGLIALLLLIILPLGIWFFRRKKQ